MTDENELERTARAAYEVLRGAHGFGPQWAELGKRDRHVWMDIAIAVLSNAFWSDDAAEGE